MAKICRVIQIKLNQLCPYASLTYQQSAFKRYHSDKHFSDGGKNQPTDMEQNYVTVTLCTVPSTSSDGQALIICNSINQSGGPSVRICSLVLLQRAFVGWLTLRTVAIFIRQPRQLTQAPRQGGAVGAYAPPALISKM